MGYRATDAQQAEAAIRQYWQARAQANESAVDALRAIELERAALVAENVALRDQLHTARTHAAALEGRKAIRAAEAAKRVLRRGPVPAPVAEVEPEAPQAASQNGPAFSVLMTVYNKGPLVNAAAESVYAQTLPDWELLIWDDGSTDPETVEVLDALDGPNTEIIRSENRGVVAARRSLAERARGEFLIFLDADDELRPTYLEKALLTFRRFPSVDLVIPSVKIVSESDGVPPVWQPAHFEERRLAYENTTPISSAFRARLWHEVGGMSQTMATGYEDWEFWRRCAHAGAQGWVLDDALFLYRHSETTGRDASQRDRHDALVRDIKQITPTIDHPARPIDAAPAAVTLELEHRVFHIPHDERRSVVVFVPWLLVGGGADHFLKTTLRALADEMNIVIIGTEPVPAGHLSDVNDFLDITPYVYHLPGLLPRDEFSAMVRSLLYRMTEPAVLNMGSPWAYEHLREFKGSTRGFGAWVDIQFNHVGHLAELLATVDLFDEVLVSHACLSNLLTDYFGVTVPVNVVHVAPPEPTWLPPTPPGRERPLVGWLGRNSPEKRPDLFVELATACPGADFVIAGGGFAGFAATVPNLRVVGRVHDALRFLGELDLLVNTSDTEGISVSAMEALQVGVPVATRDVGGMTELIRDGVNGFVYEAGDLRALAARILDATALGAVRDQAQQERLPGAFHEQTMIAVVRAAVTRKVFV